MSTSFTSKLRADIVDPQRTSFVARSASPASSKLRAFTFGQQSVHAASKQPVASQDQGSAFGERMRRSSTHSHTRSVGKGKTSIESVDSRSSVVFNDPFAVSQPHRSVSETHTTRPSSRPSFSEDLRLKHSRGSILVQASDALNSRFGRKRKSIRQPTPAPIILPGVMEISAPRHDEEVEERERLRDAAAQSIGLGPDILQDTKLRGESIDEVDENAEAEGLDGDFEMIPPPVISRSTRSSSVSSMPGLPLNNRQRAGSLRHSLTHMRTRSTTPALSIPTFPTMPSALRQSSIMTALVSKYHPSPSLRIFALSKQWKSRFVILSSPASTSSRGQVSYLHIFKSSAPGERELERLEINQDSVVFVTDEDVGSRKNVVKVGGVDAGTFRKEQGAGAQTAWLLQVPDAVEAQNWIAAIKNVILSHRSIRAGLGVPAHILEGSEPRGDMDVMLTMRTQGIISSPIPRRATLPEFVGLRQTTSPILPIGTPEPSLRSSPLSVRSQATTHRSVSAFKGLFTGSTRPRSPSRSNSVSAKQEQDSFGAMGNNLLTMIKTNGSEDVGMSPTSLPSQSRSPIIPTVVSQKISIPSPIISSADQIITDRSSVSWSAHADTSTSRHNLVMPDSALFPLQPPPHRKPSVSQEPQLELSDDGTTMYQHNNANGSVAGNFGLTTLPVEEMAIPPPVSPSPTGTSFGTPEQRDRAGSMTSVSTVASIELGGPKRWSRQGVLPKRLTPPSGPPPAVPEGQPSQDSSPISRVQIQYAYVRERASSSRSSSDNSPLSGTLGPAITSKRESNSSSYSINTASTSHSRFSIPRRNTSQRRSAPPPPPRPAPNFAPPPPPGQASPPPSPVTARPAKSSFRDSVAQRGLRLSLASPKPPPSSSLPPRPDEKKDCSHRRTISSGGESSASDSRMISTPPPPPPGPRYPPPTGPLPPPPAASSVPVSRHTSIKQRLRILSAPSSAPSAHSFTSSAHATILSSIPPMSPMDPSQPSTPIAEPITTDPNFVYFSSPEPEPLPRSSNRPPAPEPFPNSPEITALSPPPRRGSRQITIAERERLSAETARHEVNGNAESAGTDKRASLSSSVVSLVAA